MNTRHLPGALAALICLLLSAPAGAALVNSPPVVDAGLDLWMYEGTSIAITGASASDPDGDPLLFNWVQLSGVSVSISNINSLTPNITAPPTVTQGGVFITLELQVFDGTVVSTDQMNINILNAGAPPPVPVPAAAWLFGSGLLGLIGVARRRRG